MNIPLYLIQGGDQNRKYWADYLPTENIPIIILLIGATALLGYLYFKRKRIN